MTDIPDGVGLVAAGGPSTADAAASVLAAGGNAFDAAVAAGFAAAVAEPGLTSLAGGGFLLARTAAGESVVFDFFVDTPGRGLPPDEHRPHFDEVVVRFPAAHQSFHCGLGSVAVPGCLSGYLHVHRQLGRLPLADLVAPAVRLAHEGMVLPAEQAAILGLLEPILLRTPVGRSVFAPAGHLVGAGDLVRNPDLGSFLERLGSGRILSFGEGSLSAAVVGLMEAGQGLVTAEDLAAYQVVERQPLAVPFQGRTALTNPPPSFGGSLLAAALVEVDGLGARAACDPAGLVDAMRSVDRRRDDIIAAASGGAPNANRGTTQVSISDAEGNVASMTTSNGEHSGEFVPGTGIMLNNMLGEDDLHPSGFHSSPPGQRVASMMSPTVVVGDGGDVGLVVGSGGSKRIRSALLQVVVNVLVHGMEPAAAVEAPRVHWDADHTEAEPGLDVTVLERLAQLGPVNVWPAPNMYFGGAHAIVPGIGAGGDPRRDGAVRAVRRR